ncbi:MAG: cardiolipin synthase ClsB [Oxalobacteraceae bacterium]
MISYSHSNELALLHRGEEFFPALVRACEHARAEIYLETYIFALDDTGHHVKAALRRAAARGVTVHVLVDWLGTGQAVVMALKEELDAVGVRFACFNPWFRKGIARTHRKLVVIDRRLAFLGGLNINDDLLSDDGSRLPLPAPRWDFAVSVSGPLVAGIHAEAVSLWARQQPQTLRRRFENLRRLYAQRFQPLRQVEQAALVVRDNLRNRNTIQRALLQALGHAHQTAWLVTPYFAPGRKLRKALMHAAQRGVKVTLLIGVGQFRLQDAVAQSFYPRLLRAGVKIVEYRRTQLHAKVAVIDDHWATIGSSNFDGLSLFVNHEANVIVRDPTFSQALCKSIAQGVSEGVMVSADQVAQFSRWRRIGNRLAYLLYKIILQALSAGRYTK